MSFDAFQKIDMRSGTVTRAEPFPRAKNPSFKVWVDFGPQIGVLQTAAQVTVHYTPDTLVGRRVVGCINLGERNIAGFTSQFLLMGCADATGAVCLLTTDPAVPNGQKVF